MDPIAKVKDGKLQWMHDGGTIFRLRLQDLNGRMVTVKIEPVRRKVSQRQRGWFFGVVIPVIRGQLNVMGGDWHHAIASADGKTTGITYHLGLQASTESIKRVLYALCGDDKTLSTMSTSEFNEFKVKIQDTVNTDLDGLYIPDPNEGGTYAEL